MNTERRGPEFFVGELDGPDAESVALEPPCACGSIRGIDYRGAITCRRCGMAQGRCGMAQEGPT